jgi:hypothetical protein
MEKKKIRDGQSSRFALPQSGVSRVRFAYKIPVRWIGIGESADDLMPFDPKAYADGLFDL